MVQVLVRFNKVDYALKMLKLKLQREGVFRAMKLKRFYQKPSRLKVLQQEENQRRKRKLDRRHSF